VRGEARGDVLTALDADRLGGMPLLLANPGVALGTGEVFARWDGIDRGALAVGNPLAAARAGRNDLTDAACALVPEIAHLLDLLESLSGTLLVRMSGSGATCFALFESIVARDIGAAMVSLAMPEAWLLPTRLRSLA
jgi:4-diphosphocytidyl-2-C-methyl-D-erythritol kinase